MAHILTFLMLHKINYQGHIVVAAVTVPRTMLARKPEERSKKHIGLFEQLESII